MQILFRDALNYDALEDSNIDCPVAELIICPIRVSPIITLFLFAQVSISEFCRFRSKMALLKPLIQILRLLQGLRNSALFGYRRTARIM
jgi:hypothetical protein